MMNYSLKKAGSHRAWYNIFMLKKIFSILFIFILFINLVPNPVYSATKEQLEQELQEIERQIQIYEKQLRETTTQKQSLANKVASLKTQQAQIILQIRQTGIQIDNLETSLEETKKSISETNLKIKDANDQIGEVIRQLYEQDRHSLVEMMLADGSLAGSFQEVGRYENLSKHLADKVTESKRLRSDLERHFVLLDEQSEEAQSLLSIQSLQNQQLQARLSEQNQLLKDTKGKEETYQALVADSRRRANEIRGRLYDLLGVGRQVTFGEALAIAEWISEKTGVRAAFLLAVLTQESNLGKNVGTCNRAGDPPSKSWRVIMKPTRDQAPFLKTTAELGLNPDITPVSCPMRDRKGNQIGWGGAMGPAQFIPSTWVGYKDRVSAVTGISPANPWDIRDAFVAAAILLKNNGATSNGENGEWAAAMRYFSGSTNTRFRFYGDNVLKLARQYQVDIDALK